MHSVVFPALHRHFIATPPYTQLKVDLKGVDPDQVYNHAPYEKGYMFVARLEAQVRETDCGYTIC